MTEQVAFERISPVVPVLDLDTALDCYRRPGFHVQPSTGDERYGFVGRGPVSLHLTEWHEHEPGRTAAQVSIDVSDADALHGMGGCRRRRPTGRACRHRIWIAGVPLRGPGRNACSCWLTIQQLDRMIWAGRLIPPSSAEQRPTDGSALQYPVRLR